jgi:bacteriocin-like protein
MKTISISELANVSGGTTYAQFPAVVLDRQGFHQAETNLSRRPNTDDNGAVNGGNFFLRLGNYPCGNGGICGGQATDR